jgi:hypothetical protein
LNTQKQNANGAENHIQKPITDKPIAATTAEQKHEKKKTDTEHYDTTTDTETESTKQKPVPGL